MKLKITTLLTAAVAMFAVSTVNASADHRHWQNQGGYYHHAGKHRPHHRRQPTVVYKKRDKGDLLAAGLIGAAVGAVIVGTIAEQNRRRSHQVYRHPSPAYVPAKPNTNYYPPAPGRHHVNSHSYGAEPWSPEWYRYCRNRYRSFNSATGTFRGYDGRDHFCVVK